MSLLLLFNEANEVIYIDNIQSTLPLALLNIQDVVSRNPIPVLGYLKGEYYIQGMTTVYPPLEFQMISENMSAGESNYFMLQGSGRVIMKCIFSHSDADCNLRFCFFDKNNKRCISEIYNIHATTIQEEGKYISEMKVLPSYGAEKISILVEHISNGTIDIWLSEV